MSHNLYYPTLGHFPTKYWGSTFRSHKQNNKIFFELASQGVEQMIKDKIASYAIRIKCKQMLSAETILSSENLNYISLPDIYLSNNKMVNEKIFIEAFILLTKDVIFDDYFSYIRDEINNTTYGKKLLETAKENYDLPKGSFLAYDTIITNKISALDSIFEHKSISNNMPEDYTINLSEDKIHIQIKKEVLDKMNSELGANSSKKLRSLFLRYYIIPVLLEILNTIEYDPSSDEDNINEEYSSHRWCVILVKLIKENFEKHPGLKSDSLLTIAQSLFHFQFENDLNHLIWMNDEITGSND